MAQLVRIRVRPVHELPRLCHRPEHSHYRHEVVDPEAGVEVAFAPLSSAEREHRDPPRQTREEETDRHSWFAGHDPLDRLREAQAQRNVILEHQQIGTLGKLGQAVLVSQPGIGRDTLVNTNLGRYRRESFEERRTKVLSRGVRLDAGDQFQRLLSVLRFLM